MKLNLLEIVVLAVLVVMVISGLRKGFVRKLASVISLVLSIVLISLVLPYMTDFLKNSTPVYEYIVEQCESAVSAQLTSILTGSGSAAADTYRNMGRDQVKALMEQYGYDSSVVDGLGDEQFEQYKNQFIDEYLGQTDEQQASGIPDTLSLSDEQQETVINSLPLPEVLKKQILKYNNREGYLSLQASTFQDYIINYIASAILNVVAFLLALIFVQVIIRVIIHAMDLLSHIPGLSFLNRLAGGAVGVLQWLFLMWLFFLVLSMCQATEAGQYLLNMVWESDYLNLLYDSNLFVQIVLRAAAVFAG